MAFFIQTISFFVRGETHNWKESKIYSEHASVGGCVGILTLVHWSFGFLATLARTKVEIRLNLCKMFSVIYLQGKKL